MLYVVTGPPCAGKTRWVMDSAGLEDIVIDFDRLAVALAGPGADTHEHPKHLRDVAFPARAAAINAALQLADTATVYLIHTQPNAAAWARYHRAGAEVVTLDPGRAVVEARARAERPRASLAVIGKWYAQPPRRHPAPALPPVAVPKSASPVAARTRHRMGRPYRRARQQMFATYGDTCHLCGHPGAGEADHLVPISLDASQPIDPHLMRPAHGGNAVCPTCGRACNASRGNGPIVTTLRTSQPW